MAEAITKIQSGKVDNASPTGKMNRANLPRRAAQGAWTSSQGGGGIEGGGYRDTRKTTFSAKPTAAEPRQPPGRLRRRRPGYATLTRPAPPPAPAALPPLPGPSHPAPPARSSAEASQTKRAGLAGRAGGGGHVGGGGEQRRAARARGPRPKPGRQGALYRRRPPPGQCAAARCSLGATAPQRAPPAAPLRRPLPGAAQASPAGLLGRRLQPLGPAVPRRDPAPARPSQTAPPRPRSAPRPPPPAPDRTAHAHCVRRLHRQHRPAPARRADSAGGCSPGGGAGPNKRGPGASRPALYAPPLWKKRSTVTRPSADRAVVAEETQHSALRASQSGPTAALRHRGRNSGLAHSPALRGGGGRALQHLTTHSLLVRIPPPPQTGQLARPSAEVRSQAFSRSLANLFAFCFTQDALCVSGCTRSLNPPTPHPILELYLLQSQDWRSPLPSSSYPLNSRPAVPSPTGPVPSLPQPHHHPGVQRVTWRTWFLECEKLRNKPPARMLSGQMTVVLLESALYTVTCSPIVA
ncbi:TPA: hypothetical protein BOS_106 [Bos taurus]|nr:TPA: hypothetical protein BOS_106 [Bos taurus]